ncbi:hypothetical protein C8J57DRAFT_1510726 [Mycena rebaudengoi]|nr:hypothetical protein C8J57DRAFT_1528432 [Mycena rebaudengoi]KAJ7266616.1 hypothetical protein C8J57DRAFT_1510726 [Mycena rebaudengoi]
MFKKGSVDAAQCRDADVTNGAKNDENEEYCISGFINLFLLKRENSTGLTEDEDLSIDVLFEDFVCVLQAVFADPAAAPSLLFAWAAVSSCARAPGCSSSSTACPASRSAMEALPHMLNLLNACFDGFDSPEAAIEWQWVARPSFLPRSTHDMLGPLKVKTIHIATSVPAQSAGVPVATSLWSTVPYRIPLIPLLLLSPVLVLALLPPTSHASDCFLPLPPPSPPSCVSPLRPSSPAHRPLRRFLAACTARLLLLAGMDRLDRPLMIAQMQGSST